MVHRTSLGSPVFGLRREIDRLFEDTFGRDSGRSGWAPPVDVRENDKEIVLEMELPGVKPSDVEVTTENNVLTIRGEKRSSASGQSEARYHVVERSYGAFSRSFQLPAGLDDRRIEAEFEDGLLVVRVPKTARAQPRRVEIRSSGNHRSVQGTPTSGSSTQPAQGTEAAAEATGVTT